MGLNLYIVLYFTLNVCISVSEHNALYVVQSTILDTSQDKYLIHCRR